MLLKYWKKDRFIGKYSAWLSSIAAIFNNEVENRTRVARTQLEFTARDHEFTSWMERSIVCFVTVFEWNVD